MALCDNDYPTNPSSRMSLRLGPILSLPPEILNHIVKYLRPNRVLSLRQTCRYMYHNACSKFTLKAALSDRVLPRESLALACMMEHDHRLPEKRLVCGSCTYHHSSTSFDPIEELLPPEIRVCGVEKFQREKRFVFAMELERCGLSPLSLLCSACKESHRFDLFDVVERVKPSEDRSCTVFAKVTPGRYSISTVKASRWQGALDPLPREVGDQDVSGYRTVLQQLDLFQAQLGLFQAQLDFHCAQLILALARLGQLLGLLDRESISNASGKSCED